MNDTLFQIAKERYDSEMERKNNINNSISLPIGIIAVISGFVIKILDFYSEYRFSDINMVYKISTIIFLVVLGFAYYYLIRGVFIKYQYIITPVEWNEFYNKLVDYYGLGKPRNEVDLEMKNELYEQYCNYSWFNFGSNNSKNNYLSKSKIIVVISLVAVFVNITAQLWDKKHLKKDEDDKIVKFMMVEDRKEVNMQQPKPPQNPSGQNRPAAEKPKPNPGPVINEGIKPKPPAGRMITGDNKD